MRLNLDCTGRQAGTITNFLVDKITELIESSTLPAGTRLPSIRNFAQDNHVSRFTVVQVYDRLVADGLLQSRPGSGFYVLGTLPREKLTDDTIQTEVFHSTPIVKSREWLNPGRGSLPSDWLNNVGLDKAIRRVGRSSLDELMQGYSDIYGYEPLREQIRQRLLSLGISASIHQVMTVSGALPGVDLVCRTILKPNDIVLIDQPGYYMLNGLIANMGIKIIGVPLTENGPDIEQLERLAQAHKPKAYITSAINQNPTSITLLPSVLHQVLGIAEKNDFWIIEDDVFGVFHSESPLRYAALDQLNRVIYVNSFSKTISGKLRVGYLALPEKLIEPVLDKRVLGGRTSELAERVTHELLREGNYRKHILHLIGRLQKSREKTIKAFAALGFEFLTIPEYGEFVWVRLNGLNDSKVMADAAMKHEIHLMPGNHFMIDGRPSPWMRFSVAWCQDPRLIKFLKDFITEQK